MADASSKDASSGVWSDSDLILITTEAASTIERWFHDDLGPIVRHSITPLCVLRPTEDWRSRWTQFRCLLVCLDGSESAEKVLPYARLLTSRFQGQLLLLGVPEAEDEEPRLRDYLQNVATGAQ